MSRYSCVSNYSPLRLLVVQSLKKCEYDKRNTHLIVESNVAMWNLTVMFVTARFCPFRFMHGDKPVSAEDDGLVDLSSGEDDNCASVYSAHQPRPEMFGFGKHMCPGREVAKLQILLFLKFFMSKFDYELVNGQVSLRARLCTRPILHDLQYFVRARAQCRTVVWCPGKALSVLKSSLSPCRTYFVI